MKRPFALLGITLFFLELIQFIIGRADVSFFALLIFALSAVTALFFKRIRQDMHLPLIFVAAALSCLLFLVFSQDRAVVQSLTGDNASVEAVISEAPYRNSSSSRYYTVCKLKAVSGERVSGKIRLSFSPDKDGIDPESLDIGSKITFSGKVYVPGEGEKSIERYFASENILLGAYSLKNVEITPERIKGVGYYFHRMRSYVASCLSFCFSDKVAGVLVGILTGDKSCLDDDLYKAFRDSGIAHLMAVSGLHLSVWVFFLSGVMSEDGRFYRLKYLFLLFATAFIMLLAGMSESVTRAGFMSAVYLIGKLGKRRSDGLNSLGIAVFVMILLNPACVMSISLQLSFLSTLSILTLGRLYMEKSRKLFGGEKINTVPRKLLRLCFDSFCISVSVLIFTFPVLIYAFGGISTVSAFVNILLIPVTTPLLVLTGAFAVISKLGFIALPVSYAVNIISRYLISVSEFFSGFKNAFLVFEYENLLLYFAGTLLVLLFTLLFLKERFRARAAVTCLCLVLCAVMITAYETNDDKIKIHLDKVGDEISCVLEDDGKAVLLRELSTYEKGLLESALEERGAALTSELKKEEGLTLRKSSDGKRLYYCAQKAKLSENITAEYLQNGIKLKCRSNNIYIFDSEDLQQPDDCDIIIKITDNDIILTAGKETFSLSEENCLTVVLKKNSNFYVKGEGLWRILMKSN